MLEVKPILIPSLISFILTLVTRSELTVGGQYQLCFHIINLFPRELAANRDLQNIDELPTLGACLYWTLSHCSGLVIYTVSCESMHSWHVNKGK